MSPSISISDAFDGGNIELVEHSAVNGGTTVSLRIKQDPYTQLEKCNHFQYFCFRATVAGIAQGKSVQVNYVIDNAAAVSYPEAWDGTTVFFSSSLNDADSWKRKLNTVYDNGKLSWTHVHEYNGSMYFAHFPPFSYSRHLDLIEKCSALADVQSLGQSLDGREIELVKVGSGKRVCWIIHRQHPGETMAEYYAEGLLTRLLGFDREENDDVVERVLEMYTFYIVPCMCPDGAVRGHLRTNACGANLNREWATTNDYVAPTMERSPEVYYVMKKMEETGCDVFLDIHGDEELPYVFASGTEEANTWGPRLKNLYGAFVAAYTRSNSDMQKQYGYDDFNKPESVGEVRIANVYDCLSVVLEMPFKDCATNPDPERGWSPERSRKLGASVLEPLVYVHPYLRAEGEFWKDLPEDDAYVTPTTKLP